MQIINYLSVRTNFLIVIFFILSFKNFAQNSQINYQKNRYDLAIGYFKKGDYKNALREFSNSAKIKPENEIGNASQIKIDTLRKMLRKNILAKVVGTWKVIGDKPGWSVDGYNNVAFANKMVQINQGQILFFELDSKTNAKKLIKTEYLVFYNKDQFDDLFAAIILSDGTIWECLLNENENILHVINIAKKTDNGVQKILYDNLERFLCKIN